MRVRADDEIFVFQVREPPYIFVKRCAVVQFKRRKARFFGKITENGYDTVRLPVYVSGVANAAVFRAERVRRIQIKVGRTRSAGRVPYL